MTATQVGAAVPFGYQLSLLDFAGTQRSREPRRSFGAVCAGAVDVSIASGETTDNVVFVVGFVVTDGALNPTGLEVEGTSLVCVVPWLLPRFTGAFGGAVFKEGGAAEAAPPMGACGVCLGTLGVIPEEATMSSPDMSSSEDEEILAPNSVVVKKERLAAVMASVPQLAQPDTTCSDSPLVCQQAIPICCLR
ncbi:hypothetical protein HPB51_001780 [Rhipicephalus microplus]|uniref:Uncharacterized protein n=1 Tax=Rhipicephalus microplus TaxID=6941 RepID=A0A9J6E637_RHIMP|nr:hypothetical protein HPB51_001780 [Rhipicephalus microplus]